MSKKRKFKWMCWNYDLDGYAYVIAKGECPKKEDVPEYIVEKDNLSPDTLNPDFGDYLSVDDVEEGWCSYQCRSDWWSDYYDNPPAAGYFVVKTEKKPDTKNNWFPVWIVRRTGAEWY